MGRLTTRFNSFQGRQFNWDAPTNYGTLITPGTSDAKGAWVDVFGGTLTDDAYGLWIGFLEGVGSNTDTLVDVGVDNSGGTSYRVLIANLVAGFANSLDNGRPYGETYYFPIFIPAGSRIAARGQQNLGVAVGLKTRMMAFQKPSHPEQVKCGSFVDSIGPNTANSRAVAVTAGNAAKGAWALLGSVPRDGWYCAPGPYVNCTQAANYLFDFGVGDGTTFRQTVSNMFLGTDSNAVSVGWTPAQFLYATLPAGSQLYARAQCDRAPDQCYAAAYVVGGFGRS